jgi:ATP-dependent Lon protease
MKKEPKIITMGQIDLSRTGSYAAPDLEHLPIIATRNLVLFPRVAIPIALVRESSKLVAQKAFDNHLTIGLCCQTDPKMENPTTRQDVAPYGVFVEILQIFELPDGTQSAFLRATGRFKVKADVAENVLEGSPLNLSVSKVNESLVGKADNYKALTELIVSAYKELVAHSDGDRMQVNNIDVLTDYEEIINTICTQMPSSPEDKMDLLSTYRLINRGEKLLKLLNDELQKLSLVKDIMERAREELSQDQREGFMRRQMEIMQRELYGDIDDADQLTLQAEDTKLSPAASEAFQKGIAQLRRLSPNSPDYAVVFNYLNTMLDLPWGIESELNTSLPKAKKVMEECHYGMAKVKERILEQVAVTIANPNGKAPILCLVGAPGVGKTSLGESIARALGRNYQRVSLGGVSDEAEIRGHRRTYIGAMAGRIIDALRKAKSSNPLLLLDEIDKLSKDIKGDPASALLEVLDPEQNYKFHDNFIDVDFDLSKVLFIATANTLDTIPRPLLDRMEVVEVPGYLLEEKIEIAKRHLIPKVANSVGFADNEFSLSDTALTAVIEGYTSESGVRQLEKCIASIARKLLVKKMSGERLALHLDTADDVKFILGPERFSPQRYETLSMPGVVTGLAWTSHGGEILFIESSLSKGKGEKLTLTGNLGDVMKESATIALQYVRSHADDLNIPQSMFEEHNLHIHVPEGAVPKDGPSAGITMAVSSASTFTGRMVKPRLAMTGEITLRGRVMPVGGIKEKILAAKRAGITDIIICSENRKDIEQIEKPYISGLTFHYVDNVADVLSIALV